MIKIDCYFMTPSPPDDQFALSEQELSSAMLAASSPNLPTGMKDLASSGYDG